MHQKIVADLNNVRTHTLSLSDGGGRQTEDCLYLVLDFVQGGDVFFHFQVRRDPAGRDVCCLLFEAFRVFEPMFDRV